MGQHKHSVQTGLGGFSSQPVDMLLLDEDAWLLDTASQAFAMTAPGDLYVAASPDAGLPQVPFGQQQPTKVGGVRVTALGGGAGTWFRVHAVSSNTVNTVGYSAATEVAKGRRFFLPAGDFFDEQFAIGPGYTLLIEIISGGFAATAGTVYGMENHWMLS